MPDVRAALADLKTAIENQAKALTGTINLVAEDPSIPEDRKTDLVIHLTSAICERTTALQPIPFADLFILSPIQVVMILALSKVMGNTVTRQEALELIGSVLKNTGAGVLATQGMLGLYKTAMPLLGRAVTMPMIYSSTAGLGYAAKAILEAQREDKKLTSEEVLRAKRQGEAFAKARRGNWTTEALTDEIDLWRNRMAQYDDYRKRMSEAQSRIRAIEAEVSGLEEEDRRIERLLYKQDEVKAEFQDAAGKAGSILEQQNAELFKAERKRQALLDQLAAVDAEISEIQERRRQSEQSIAEIVGNMQHTSNLTPANLLDSKAEVERKIHETNARKSQVRDERTAILAERFESCYAWVRPTETALKALAALDDEALHGAERGIADAQSSAPGTGTHVLDAKDGRLSLTNEQGEEKTVAKLDAV